MLPDNCPGGRVPGGGEAQGRAAGHLNQTGRWCLPAGLQVKRIDPSTEASLQGLGTGGQDAGLGLGWWRSSLPPTRGT